MSYEKKTLLYSMRRALSLHALLTVYFENFPVFSIDQILIHTGRDFYRVKEMIEKCLQL